MDCYFAVFNIKDYERRKAREAFIREYGRKKYDTIIAPYFANGIMTIFHDDPTPMTVFWVNEVSRMVCKRLGETFEPVKLP